VFLVSLKSTEVPLKYENTSAVVRHDFSNIWSDTLTTF